MTIIVKYISDETEYNFDRFEDITNPENVLYINCNYNKLESLPENMNLPLLKEFYCSGNQLVSLPENMDKMFPQLQRFHCDHNKLVSLPENMYFPFLQHFYCCYNQLVSLPENMDKLFPQLQQFDCSSNKLIALSENMDKLFSQLQYFNCSHNKLVSLPENMDKMFPQLKVFYCSYNQMVSLPENMNLPQLKEFDCYYNYLTSLPENIDKMFPLLQKFNCNNNKLTSLPENMTLPLLEIFNCCHNQITSLPNNMYFPLLTIFHCNDNELASLPESIDKMLPMLQELYCSENNLLSLPENMNFPQLTYFYCNNNQLVYLPENMNLPQLYIFVCSENNLLSLPENMDKMFPHIHIFDLTYNQLVSLPVCIMNWRNLQYIYYSGNEIELTPQLERFLNRISQGSTTKINVYGDTQNVHNSAIQGSVRDSINRLTTRQDLPKFDSAMLNTMILSEDIILPAVKQQLIEYCQDDSVHSLLLLTFAEVLWYVLNTVLYDFSNDVSVQNEIKRVLNQEMQDAECKCFTGRMNRVVNCLNGFSPLVEVKISDGEQIGNVIVMLKEKAQDTEGNYSVEKHKQLAERELVERGYDSETVHQWLAYIE